MTDRWFYPGDVEGDLKGIGLPDEVVAETLPCAWEYTRCVIPQFTNWERYIAFTRIIVIGIIAEFRGGLVDVATSPRRSTTWFSEEEFQILTHRTR